VKSHTKSVSRKSRHQTATIEQAIKLLQESEFRITQPRQMLLELIFAQPGPFSAPQLEKLFKQKHKRSKCDPVTIYRTLPVLEKLGIIERCGFSEDKSFYEVMLNHHGHHHHIVCDSCQKVEPIDFCVVDGQEQILKKLGYTNLKHRLEFTGLCPNCS
jgi:Fe2+ or Zn2+ uptake regulation protein